MRESVPLYHKLKSALLRKIETDEWQVGMQLPSESELATQFDVSRTTVRQAIGDLVSGGYVVRKQGKGTYVAERSRVTTTASHLYGFVEDLRNRGYDVTVNIHEVNRSPCDPTTAEKLNVAAGTEVITIARTADVDGVCYFHETSHLVAPFALQSNQDLDFQDDSFEHIYGFMERNGVQIASGTQFIRAEMATSEDLRTFSIQATDAMLVIIRVTKDSTGSPVEYSEVRYPGHLYEYVVSLLRHPV